MSMLSEQADRLREKADELRNIHVDDENVGLLFAVMGDMREAADTIESLRKQVAKCQIAELKADYDTSRHFELFGTPERAARTLLESTSECRCCVIRKECGYDLDACVMYDYDKLLEWLRGDAEYAKGGAVSENYIDDGESGSICPIPRASVIFDGQKLTFDEEDSAAFAELVRGHFRKLAGLEGDAE